MGWTKALLVGLCRLSIMTDGSGIKAFPSIY